MNTHTATPPNPATQTLEQEHNLKLDGVIELANIISEKDFFDGLLGTVIDYVEQHNGMAALSINHNKLTDEPPGDGKNEPSIIRRN